MPSPGNAAAPLIHCGGHAGVTAAPANNVPRVRRRLPLLGKGKLSETDNLPCRRSAPKPLPSSCSCPGLPHRSQTAAAALAEHNVPEPGTAS
jgi:hypothetical protein